MEENKKQICLLVQELKENYQQHNLSAESKEAIDKHLKTCNECRNKYLIKKNRSFESKSENEKIQFIKLSQKLKHRKIRNILLTIGIIAIIFVVYQICFIKAFLPGGMEPTINSNSSCYAYRLAYAFSDPKQGDIVMYRLHDFSDVSRILALPGDEVMITEQGLSVNGNFVEGYENLKVCTESKYYENGIYKVIVPEDCYFMIGDDLNNSYDSRYDSFGFVNQDDIYGKVVLHFGSKNTFMKKEVAIEATESTFEDIP